MQTITFQPRATLKDLVARRIDYLTVYQNAAYADSYKAFVAKVQCAEEEMGKTALTEAVARNLFKLMAYKDEYEVARLHSDPVFRARIEGMFEGDFKLHYHLAPPLLAKKNDKGQLVKRKYGPWMGSAFQLLAQLKGLRGSALDPFGYTEERRQERALIHDYRAAIEQVLDGFTPDKQPLALEIARLPEQIKGFGHVKARNLAAVRGQWAELLARWRGV